MSPASGVHGTLCGPHLSNCSHGGVHQVNNIPTFDMFLVSSSLGSTLYLKLRHLVYFFFNVKDPSNDWCPTNTMEPRPSRLTAPSLCTCLLAKLAFDCRPTQCSGEGCGQPWRCPLSHEENTGDRHSAELRVPFPWASIRGD